MKCERSVITMTLHWHSFEVFSLGNCIEDPPTETVLKKPEAMGGVDFTVLQSSASLYRWFHESGSTLCRIICLVWA